MADCLREAIRQPTRRGGPLWWGGVRAVIARCRCAGRQRHRQRIAAALAGRGILHAQSEVSDRVTVSQGIALWHGGQDGIADMLVRADEALYQVKEAGRNGYRLAPESAPAATG